MFRRLAVFAFLAGCTIPAAQAQLQVEISGAGANQYPIAIADFADSDGARGRQIADVVRADLTRSGLFRMVNPSGVNLNAESQLDFAVWRDRGANAVAYGTSRSDGSRLDIDYRMADTVQQAVIDGQGFTAPLNNWRAAAHQLADRICERLSGAQCAFSTKIAYVLKRGNLWELQIADADGHNAQTALRSREAIISPAWSPDGSRLAYVSFESGKPVVYVHHIATGQRTIVANFRGNNSAPAWSPDGNRLAVVLSRDGSSQIYLVNADGSNPTRLTQSGTINTEPSFSPDGRSIVFSSDRGGSAQIYRMGVDGSNVTRLSFNGGHNVSPRISPDGTALTYVTRRGGSFQIAVLNLSSGNEVVLTNGPDDQSPSFSPDGGMVLYAAGQRGGTLNVRSIDGLAQETLSAAGAGVSAAAWGPFGTAK
ncbi:Tol-Pal system protein TolB [Verticiella sediminum]|uniref:Tol-Pal system protein TolB n=1 Tax=Verticiella sediminum TaxID=1247510 RepID=A0A556B102_9BURK|nr:Tol-Pal system beta propeller repeat protein TolB [Verticiella sediminum]TSH98877.1 Tol-Pal system protein TolB [Verticiella sediminum]